MNFKLIFPTYRTRFNEVTHFFKSHKKFDSLLNVGCGEGEFDPLLRRHTNKMYGCDINKNDIIHCEQANKKLKIHYSVQDARSLKYKQSSFDGIVCMEVLEYLGNYQLAIKEMSRVLHKNGTAVITIPNKNFPFTYDPINYVLSFFGKHISFGAYAYGHEALIDEQDIESFFKKNGFSIVKKKRL